jgi:putative peptide zinc metalloprotease protein
MSESSKKIVLPAYLLRRFEAFRIVKDGETSYLVRDKVQSKVHDFQAWQFFILEVLPGCETLDKLQSVFKDRFDRDLQQADVDEFFGMLADRNLLDETAAQHPLLAPFTKTSYEVADGKATRKPHAGGGTTVPTAAAAPAPAPAAAPAPRPAAGGTPPRDQDLPAGVQDAIGMDWRTTDRMLGLFDPRPLLRLVGPLLRPLRYLVYAVPLLVLAALIVIGEYGQLMAVDLQAIAFDVTLFEHLLFAFISVHLVTNFTAALVADHYKVAVDKVGITLTFGFIPRWVLKMSGAERLTRKQTMWLHGSMLIARVVMFSIGVLVWFNTRDAQTGLHAVGLTLAFVATVGLLLEAGNPLVKANGYYLLSAYLNEPHLRGKAYAALVNKFNGGQYRAADNTILALYALLSTSYVLLLVGVVAWMLAKFLLGDLRLGGSAFLLILAFVAYMVWRNLVGLKNFGATYARQLQYDRWRNRTLPEDAEPGEIKTPKMHYWRTALLVCLVLALFIPYPYAAGGDFKVYPARREALSADTAGLVEAVFFSGGESVPAGTPVARLASTDLQGEIKVLEAKIAEQQAEVRNLRTLPRPEEVRLAEQRLEVDRTRERFSRERVPRMDKLYQAGAVSFDEFDKARKDHLTDVEQVAEREAELALVKTPITADQILAAEAKLASLNEERARLLSRVDRTVLRMPFDGNILTLHLHDKVGIFLDRGVPFAALEDSRSVIVEIAVAEADLRYVEVGAPVRVRPVSFFEDTEFAGKVTLIDRNVTAQSTGNVVKVLASIDNPEGKLRTGMAGKAKIAGVEMPAWKAFTLGIVRFFQIQVWSWLP